MTKQEMWEAVKNSDANYDGLFFLWSKDDGDLLQAFLSVQGAEAGKYPLFQIIRRKPRKAGFRPCKRCRSDLLEYQPMHEIADEIRQKLEQAAVAQEAPRTGRSRADRPQSHRYFQAGIWYDAKRVYGIR